MNIESPCIGLCQLDDKHCFCQGCLRSLSEIASWSQCSDRERAQIIARTELRKRSIVEAVKPRGKK